MLFYKDNSKTFCSNYYPPQDMKLAVSSDMGKQYAPRLERAYPWSQSKFKKKMTPPSQALLKLSKSWWDSRAERLYWVPFHDSEFGCINLKIPVIRDQLQY